MYTVLKGEGMKKSIIYQMVSSVCHLIMSLYCTIMNATCFSY